MDSHLGVDDGGFDIVICGMQCPFHHPPKAVEIERVGRFFEK
jgi:hypothetical protein